MQRLHECVSFGVRLLGQHDLATRMKKARKESGDESWVPWVPFELKRFLPDCFGEHVITNFEVEEDRQPKVSSRRLELAA